MTVILDSLGIHMNVFQSRQSVWKQGEDTVLIWRFIMREESSMMPRLRAWSVGVGGVPSVAGQLE